MKETVLVSRVDDLKFLALISVIGLAVGFGSYHLIGSSDNGDNYCESIEQGIRENRTIDGPIACFEPPENMERNNVSQIENLTELECLCEYNINGEKRTFAVRRSQ